MTCDLGLGSNVGDRLARLQAAVDGLRSQPGVDVVAVSGVYETDPVGGPPQGPYLNAAVRIETSLAPRDLLRVARALEEAAGRVREARWGPRTLDVDLLRCGDVPCEQADLVLPHPRMHERPFVLVPLADVDPDVDLSGTTTEGVHRTDLLLR